MVVRKNETEIKVKEGSVGKTIETIHFENSCEFVLYLKNVQHFDVLIWSKLPIIPMHYPFEPVSV